MWVELKLTDSQISLSQSPKAQCEHTVINQPCLSIRPNCSPLSRDCQRKAQSTGQTLIGQEEWPLLLRLCDSLVRAWRVCVFAFQLKFLHVLCDSVCSVCCNNGRPKMASLVLATTNSAVPVLNKLLLPSKSFQPFLWPLALSITSCLEWCGKGRPYRARSTPYTQTPNHC